MLNNLLLNGGRVLIVGGLNKAWESYRKFPQLEFWSGEQKDIQRFLRTRDIPENCKAVVISRFISHSELNRILAQARKRGVTLFPNKNDGEVANLLEEMTCHLRNGATMTVTETKANPVDSVNTNHILPPKKMGGHQPSKLHVLIPFMDFSQSDITNARALFKKAEELKVTTTVNSLAQFVRVHRRKVGAAPSPLSRPTHPKRTTPNERKEVKSESGSQLDITVQMLDSLIKDLQGMRDYLISVTDENNQLKAKFAAFKSLFKE